MKYTVIVIVLFFWNLCEICMSSEINHPDVVNDLFGPAINFGKKEFELETTQIGNEMNKENFIIPDFMDSPVKGVSFFYLDGRRKENLPLLVQKLVVGDEGMSTRLVKTVDEIKKSGFNWVRIVISSGLYKQYDYVFSDYDYDQDIYPLMSNAEAMKINSFIDYFRKGTDGLKIELLLSSGFIDDTKMRDKEKDALFFESILRQIDTNGIELVMLGGDIMPCNIISLVLIDDTVCDENGPNDNWNDAEWIKFQLNYFMNHPVDRLRGLSYSFDTITYPTVNAFKTYLNWVNDNVVSYVPVVSVSSYYAQEGATELDYLNHFNTLVDAYMESGIKKPFWLDEYGFGLQDSFTEKDAFLYLKGFLRATRCKNGVDSSLFYPSIAWVIGSDRIRNVVWPVNTEYYGLFKKYDAENAPVVSQSWDLIKWFNTTQGVCSEPIPDYQEVRPIVPVGANGLLLKK